MAGEERVRTRAATADDLELATDILTLAFEDDPVWGGWAFPDPHRGKAREQRRACWRYLVRSGLRFPWVRMTLGGEAVALWQPAGESELTPQEEQELGPFIRDLLGPHANLFMEGLAAFEEATPEEPHYHLDLLGTHPAHRGQGIGMAMVETDLEAVDAEGMPTYLESTNPANLARYERAGFRKVGAFTLPNGPVVDTMWREPRRG
jgi:GNAT superfamily N-acetyltransferase